MNNRFIITCIMSATLVFAPMALHANMVDTDQVLAHEERSAQIERVETYLAREEVRSQLESLGVDPTLASERVASMTDSQLQKLALNIQDEPAGGVLGVVVVVLVIVILLEILGITNISHKI